MRDWKQIFLLTAFLFITSCVANAQSITKISQRCPSPNLSEFSSVQNTAVGNILYAPCPSRSSIFSGIVDFSGATVVLPGGGGAVSGSGTTNFIPRWTNGASGVLGNTPFSWNGTLYAFNNTALNATYLMNFTPGTTTGSFQIGNAAATGTNFIRHDLFTGVANWTAASSITLADSTAATSLVLNTAGGILSARAVSNINLDSGVGVFSAGDLLGDGNGTLFTADDSGQRYTFGSTANLASFDLRAVNNYRLQCTNTPGGTTGNQVINKPCGSVNFAAAATDITITNNIVLTSSNILCTVQSLDTTALSCRITNKANGSFHIRTPAATAETQVSFWVLNS